jgi:cytoskeletal protein CcmA (bactofilin family)
VIIKGRVTGDITARQRVEIRAPGKLFGNVTTPSLIIQEGVIFEGHCSMGGAEAAKADRKVTPFPKEEKISDGIVLKTHSEVVK